MKVEITRHLYLENVPSASGIRIYKDDIYIVGDDSAYLYKLDNNWKVTDAIPLYHSRQAPGEKMPKLIKADLEVLTIVEWNRQLLLLAMGSGSLSVERDRGFLFYPDKQQDKIFMLDLKPVYDHLRQHYDVDELNIEGAVAGKEHLYIVQRGNLNGKNWLFRYPLDKFIEYGLGQVDEIPKPHAELFRFPEVNGVKPGFSDLELLQPGMMLFSLTLENTASAYDDGEVQGSLLGILQSTGGHNIVTTVPVTDTGKPFVEKVEGLALKEKVSEHEYIVLAVSDNDDDPSGIMEVRITV